MHACSSGKLTNSNFKNIPADPTDTKLQLGKTIMTLYVYVIFDNTCRAFPPGKYNSSQIYLKMKNLNSL